MARKFCRYDTAHHLDTEEDIRNYLAACQEDGDPASIAAALGDIARAGVTSSCRVAFNRHSAHVTAPEANLANSRQIAGLVAPTLIAMLVSGFPLVRPHFYENQIPPVVYRSGVLTFAATHYAHAAASTGSIVFMVVEGILMVVASSIT